MGGSEHRKEERWALSSVPTKGLECPGPFRASPLLPQKRVQKAMRLCWVTRWAATDGAGQAGSLRWCLQKEPGTLGWEGTKRKGSLGIWDVGNPGSH